MHDSRDKHALFELAVKRYVEMRAQYAGKALEEPTLEKVVCALFDNTVKFLTTPGHPPTCMTLAGAVGCSLDASPAAANGSTKAELNRTARMALRHLGY